MIFGFRCPFTLAGESGINESRLLQYSWGGRACGFSTLLGGDLYEQNARRRIKEIDSRLRHSGMTKKKKTRLPRFRLRLRLRRDETLAMTEKLMYTLTPTLSPPVEGEGE
jgi:hypothetical protein